METKLSNDNQEPSPCITEAEEDKITKITDLSDYCLELIFNYLDLNDLLNIGLSNTVLQYAAGVVFKRKFGNDVEIEFVSCAGIICRIKGIQIDKMQCRYLIPVFGDFISSIEFNNYYHNTPENEKMYYKIFEEISENSQSLVKIKFHNSPKGLLSKFSTSLPHVESVILDQYDLNDESVLSSEIFPKLKHLKIMIFDFRFTEPNQILKQFPYLKKLALNGVDQAELKFDSFINLNPQLSWVRGKCCAGYSCDHFIAKTSQLEKFELHFHSQLRHDCSGMRQ